MRTTRLSLLLVILVWLSGCLSAPEVIKPSNDHLGVTPPEEPIAAESLDTEISEPLRSTANIPSPVTLTATVPEPSVVFTESTHTVVVYDVPVSELLFSLARDSALNLDIDPGITGTVSLNAIEQPLTSILDRIGEIADIRYEINGDVLKVGPDIPFIKSYQVDYLNLSRSSVGNVAVSTQISATGQGAGEDSQNSNEIGNNSDTIVRNVAEHAFWQTLEDNIGRIINRAVSEDGSSEDNPDIIINSESGILAVRATTREHAVIERFLEEVQGSTQRQVLIEATIAEVNLSDTYQAGIDWSLISPTGTSSVTVNQELTEIELASRPTFNLSVSDLAIGGDNQLQATLSALETFGDVSVMSSPKVMAMNNQTALLKVVDNLIYFTVDVNIDTSSTTIGGGTLTTFETEVRTVPVGFVMSVTPFIDESGGVTLNVRPTISRVISFAQDPNPALADVNVVSQIPVIQVREVESILRVDSGDIAVIGGLMQDEVRNNARGVPMLSRVPLVGKAFNYDNNETTKTELVIFLKLTVVQKGISSVQNSSTSSGIFR